MNKLLYNLPKDFNWKEYISLYNDLKNSISNEEDAITHYLKYGKNEGRIYSNNNLPKDFNWKEYISLYDDLKNSISNEEDAITHYLKYGKNENRIYLNPNNSVFNNFDWKEYIKYYEDLSSCVYTKDDAINHWINYGKNENRIFFKICELDILNILNNYSIINIKPNIYNNNFSNIIFSLSSIPTRFIRNDFIEVINSLNNQIYKAKYIVINLCTEYIRKFKYDINEFNDRIQYIKNNYNNVIINITNDFGPITKIIGLVNLYNLIDKNDKIIIVDDDWEFNDTLTYYYDLAYNIYNCEAVFIDERYEMKNLENGIISEEIFYDNYQNFAYGWLSYSMKFKYVIKLYNYCKNIIKINKNIINHDDLIVTLFYRSNKIYSCGINSFFNKIIKKDIVEIDGSLSFGYGLTPTLGVFYFLGQ
jgi:hypothetical protein